MNFILDVGGVQEGGLTDVAIEVLHRLLTHVVHGPRDQVGVGDDQVTAFLETLKKGRCVSGMIAKDWTGKALF